MHNLYAIFAKFLDICKMFSADLVNEKGNIPRRGVVPKFSDLEVISLSLAAESIGIDSESFLFSKLRWVLIIIFFEILIPPEPFMRDAPHFFYRKYNKNLL